MKRNIASMSQINKDTENDLIEAVSIFTNELTKNKLDKNLKIQEWWDANITICSEENIITSTVLWSKFKKENKLYVEENKITVDSFKDCIKNFIDASNYIEKSKNGMIEFIGFKINDFLVIDELQDGNKKITKKKDNIKTVVSLDKDNEVLIQYTSSDNNIIKIASDNEIKVWQVVSILVTNKIISKRSEARGYDKYKETEEYKSKIPIA
jgi:hypothetical protein